MDVIPRDFSWGVFVYPLRGTVWHSEDGQLKYKLLSMPPDADHMIVRMYRVGAFS